MSNPEHDDFVASRSEKLAKIEALGLDPWGGRFDGVEAIADIRTKPCLPFETATEKVIAAGRIVLRRTQGKVHFLDIKDRTGRIQVMIGAKQVGDDGWALNLQLDLGDILGVEGVFGVTRTGEPTIRAEKLTFLAKSLEPHPDKFHGIQDEEFRLRHRYLDLTYNDDALNKAKQRVAIVRAIRRLLDDRGFYEVDTPALHSIAGGAAARPFTTHHNALDIDLYLRIALELHLKRLLIGGLERVYELGRVFRNEGISRKHNPEFTMLELYQAYGDYHSMMELTEAMFVAAVDALDGQRKRKYREAEFDLTPPWPRETYGDLFAKHVGVAMNDVAGVQQMAAKHGVAKLETKEHDVIVGDLFDICVESELLGPVFVCDYPAALCPLTKRKRDNPSVAERFELYICGMEVANAYTELNDPITQEACFRRQLAGLPADESMAKMDDEFIRAMRHGMPPAGGLGVGIDRLVMLLTDAATIRDVILFPLLRPT